MGVVATAGALETFESGNLAIETAAGARHEFHVELAASGPQRAQGLMFRRQMDAAAGMLFVFPAPRVASMWMKNTLLPLDMLFIERDGRIAKIVERTVPMNLTPISSDGPVLGVLELNAGTSSRLGLDPGDRVLHPAFGEQP